jgi:hypothetical protein
MSGQQNQSADFKACDECEKPFFCVVRGCQKATVPDPESAEDQEPKQDTWGRGTLCTGKLWIVDPDKECPICGAQVDEHCGRDPDYE